MKKLIILLFAGTLLSFIKAGAPITKEERKHALDYYKETQKNLNKAVKGHSENQLNWKPADSAWSVAECLEHIAISEKSIGDWIQSTLQQPADPSKRDEVKTADDAIIPMITDRTHKVKTQEALKPKKQFGDSQETLKVFNERRDANIAFIKSTDADLRNHYLDLPFGKIDTYQGLLFLAAHSARHTLQIQEVMANPDFPKN